MEHQPIKEELIYHGPIFDLVRVHFRLPNNTEHVYDLVRHRGAVTILPVDEKGNVWFVRQFRIGAEKQLLEIPAGLLEENETPETSAARELREEIGLAAGQLDPLGEFFMVPGYSTEKMYAFLATDLYESMLPTDADEFIEKVSYPLEEVQQMIYRGEFQDGKTLATILLALPQLRKRFGG